MKQIKTSIRWGVFSTKSKRALPIAWVFTAGVVALYLGVIPPRVETRGIAQQKARGLASTGRGEVWDPISLWHQSSSLPLLARTSRANGIVGGVPIDQAAVLNVFMASPGDGRSGQEEVSSSDRELERTASFALIVQTPAQTAEQIGQLAQKAGGFLVTSNVNGGTAATAAALTVRVPAGKFDEIRTQIRNLARRLESENIEAQDVTKQYVDLEARLRNLQAEERQYLEILRKAANVKDILEVSDKMNEVRGAIEERKAQFDALRKQVETVAINVNLQAEADAQVFGLNWRPLYQLKTAAREGIDGLGNYVASMTALLFYLPTILLWLFTLLAGAALGWRTLRWAGKALFISTRTGLTEKR